MSMHSSRSSVAIRPASADNSAHDSNGIAAAFRVARGVAVAMTFVLSAALAGQAAAEAAPIAAPATTTLVTAPLSNGILVGSPLKYAPRAEFPKRDPVDAITPALAGRGFEADPHSLPGTFVVKFRDAVKARTGTKPGTEIGSMTGADLSQVRDLLRTYGGNMRQWIRKSEGELSQLEARAREHSGREQPDLAGVVLVAGVPTKSFFEAARAYSALDCVEFVAISRYTANLQAAPQGCDPGNPQGCSTPACPANCNPVVPDPIYGCNDPTCCNTVAGIDPSCNDEQDPTGWDLYCAALANQVCGPQVYNVPPGEFDACYFDATQPDFVNPIFTDVWYQFSQGSCDSPHSGPGCNKPACCAAVCTIDPSCCAIDAGGWDVYCAALVNTGSLPACADAVMPSPSTDVSPDLTVHDTGLGRQGFQYYTQSGRRGQTMIPTLTGSDVTWPSQMNQQGNPVSSQFGFSGQGFALQEMEEFQNLIWQNYQGGDPENNPYLKGGTIRVGVIESSAYTQHEDFTLAAAPKTPTQPWNGPLLGQSKVIAEAGQTPIFIEDGRISANHGTNVLGVIVAADNGFGVTGVASDAQGYFYPSQSFEEGFRAPEAIASCLVDLTAGDVMNFSWGFQGVQPYFPATYTELDSETPPPTRMEVQPVTSQEDYVLLIQLGSDLGVTSVVAAGQGPAPIQGTGVDAGAILVSAAYPGNILPGTTASSRGSAPGYTLCEAADDLEVERAVKLVRYPSSNFVGEDAGPDTTPSVSGWGFGVATTGETTERFNYIWPNTKNHLFLGVNDQPPTGAAPALQVDKLRGYTDRFGGTSAAAAMVSGVVARVQAAAKQFYGMPLSPVQVRNLFETAPGSFRQCTSPGNGDPFTQSDAPFFSQPSGAPTADSCIETPTGCFPPTCTCESHPIGSFPNLVQLAPSILTIPEFGGNSSSVDVITGGQVIGYAWSNFQIRAEDGNFLRIVAQRQNAGSTREGLTYLATGLTTDVRVRKEITIPNPTETVTSLRIQLVSRATRNFVMCGVFVKNWRRNRYEYFGSQFLTTQVDQYNFQLPQLPDYSSYINVDTNKVDMRVWTCGLGNTGRHNVEHDLIDIVANDPLVTP